MKKNKAYTDDHAAAGVDTELPAIATKVRDRGTAQADAVVTGVGLFLDHLSRKLIPA